ncbi:helix-turn-helix transcriptional regulator [Bosea sp. NBC_00550]|uniref:helix-turn-helix transcriptional regulator n=1 Tax=Bosea sp. NBC_00550 TaxID=2969621 RepID=UPI00222EBAB1|nr:AlpA family transcriptional regulator [Bosea sp. NBC_00550]UZF93732.1 AlpA family transcriptional regulator [Bosea sp. NBC_00550]
MTVADEVARQLGMTKPGELILADRICEALLRIDSVIALTGLGRSTIYRLVAEGQFPQPIKIDGVVSVAWCLTEVETWITDRRAARDARLLP